MDVKHSSYGINISSPKNKTFKLCSIRRNVQVVNYMKIYENNCQFLLLKKTSWIIFALFKSITINRLTRYCISNHCCCCRNIFHTKPPLQWIFWKLYRITYGGVHANFLYMKNDIFWCMKCYYEHIDIVNEFVYIDRI